MQSEHAILTFNHNTDHVSNEANPVRACVVRYFLSVPISPLCRSTLLAKKYCIVSMSTAYILSVIESAIRNIDEIENKDDINGLILRLEYLNRLIVREGFCDSISSSLGRVLCILKRMEEFEYTDNNETRSRRGRPSFNIKMHGAA